MQDSFGTHEKAKSWRTVQLPPLKKMAFALRTRTLAPMRWLRQLPVATRLILLTLSICGASAAAASVAGIIYFGRVAGSTHLDAAVVVGGAVVFTGTLALAALLAIPSITRATRPIAAVDRNLEQIQRLESLGVLAGEVAHDFNNILTGILCNASMIKLDAAPGSELGTIVERIELSGRRAAELCGQIQAVAGQDPADEAIPVAANAVISQTLALLRVALPKNAELAVDLAPGLPPAAASANRFRQVLINLVTNASESLQGRPQRVAIATRPAHLSAVARARLSHPGLPTGGDFVVLEVGDTGPGLAAAQIPMVFHPFYTTKAAGRGLGLPCVLRIVHQLGGALDVTSRPGLGSTFTVYFPAAPALANPHPN
jgi:signal transduction histidine kinase